MSLVNWKKRCFMCTFRTFEKTPSTHNDDSDFRQHRGSMAAEFFRDGVPLRLNCEFLWYGYDIRPNRQVFLHPAPYFARLFLFQVKGAECLAGGKSHRLKPGLIYLLPPRQAFKIAYSKGSELLYCHLHVCDQSIVPVFSEIQGVPSIDDAAQAKLLLSAWRAKDMLRFQMSVFESVSVFAEKELSAMKERAMLAQKLGKLFDAVRTSSPDQLRVDALAGRLGVTSAALSKCFTRVMKMPLKRYLTALQLKTACELLQFSNMRISEIAAQLGHCDANYFHRFFKVLTGVTPDEYRRHCGTPHREWRS